MSRMLSELEKEWLFGFASGESTVEDAKLWLETDPALVKIKTALHWAAKNGRYDMVDFLLALGVDTETKSGYTALHLATMYNHNDVVLLLTEDYGACIDSRDNSGKRPKDYLKKNAMPSVKDKLRRLDSSTVAQKPMANISSMFLQMYAATPPRQEDVCKEETNALFMSPFFLPATPETKSVKQKNSTRRSIVNSTFRKARSKRKAVRSATVEDANFEAKQNIGSPVPMENGFMDFSGVPRRERPRSEPDVGKLVQEMQSKINET